MTIRRTSALAAERRTAPHATGAAAAESRRAASGGELEATVPGEVITLYSAMIAGCESAVGSTTSYGVFRVVVYVVGVLATIITSGRAVHSVVGSVRRSLTSAEVQSAVLAFGAWGLVLPGSFLYAYLHKPALSLAIVSVTAIVTFLLGVFYAPQLKRKTSGEHTSPTGQPLTSTRPVDEVRDEV